MMLLYSDVIIETIPFHLYFIHCHLSLYCMIMNNQDGSTALLLAAEKGSTETVKLLLDKGADLNVTDSVSHCMCVCCITDCSTKHVMYHAMLCYASNACESDHIDKTT